jgi:hypothetical protein
MTRRYFIRLLNAWTASSAWNDATVFHTFVERVDGKLGME